MEFLFLLGLIVINGIFAMSELAVISANKARLEQDSDNDVQGAAVALKLANDPNRFLSTVQIGITLVGIFAGAFGGSALADDVSLFLVEQFSINQNLAEQLSLGMIILLTTYLSLVIGELVPKRIALNNPERVSTLVARPMQLLSQISAPLVWFLSKSTEVIARLLGVQGENSNFITDFEVIAMVRAGIVSGEFDDNEHYMVKGALQLDDKRVREIATPRTDIIWLDINSTQEDIRRVLRETDYSTYIVADESIDNVVGLVQSKDILTHLVTTDEINLRSILHTPFYVPQTAVALDVLHRFKVSKVNSAIVIDEYGSLAGIVTLNDIVEQVLGDIDMQDIEPIQRADGSWLVDGQYPINDIPELLENFDLPADERSDYDTLAGFVLKRMDRIPETAETFIWQNYVFEIVDMDSQRVDKILITAKPTKD